MQRQRRRGQAPGAADRATAGQWRCAPVGGNGKTISIDRDIARPLFPGRYILCMRTAYAVLIFGKNKKRFRPQPEALFATVYYTIPRTVRELQQLRAVMYDREDYTIPRTVRELQQKRNGHLSRMNYTIPRTVRELQPLASTAARLMHYTIPRTVRELQPGCRTRGFRPYYTIPRTVRELQL